MTLHRAYLVVVAVGLIVILTATQLHAQAHSVLGESTGLDRTVEMKAAVSSTFSYQGVLEENGQPVDGLRAMVFRYHSNDTCTLAVGSPVSLDVTVSDGLFTVELPADQDDFHGQALWLESEVESTSVACQQIQAVPYALSLRPGVVIQDSDASNALDGMLDVRYGTGPSDVEGLFGGKLANHQVFIGFGVHGYLHSGAGAGVYGEADSDVFANYGVYGTAASPGGSGVRGETSVADGYGGSFSNSAAEGFALGAEGQHGATVTGTHFSALFAESFDGVGNDYYGVQGVGHVGDGVFGWSHGTQNDDTGVTGRGESGYGIYGFSWASGQYGGYFPDEIFVDGCVGCGTRYVARNATNADLQQGDVLRVAGVQTGLEGMQTPVLKVAPARAGKPAIGVVVGRTQMTMVEPGINDAQPGAHFGPVGGTVKPGDYLVVALDGIAQVRVDPAADIRVGGTLYVGGRSVTHQPNAAPIGTALDQVDADGLVWVLVNR